MHCSPSPGQVKQVWRTWTSKNLGKEYNAAEMLTKIIKRFTRLKHAIVFVNVLYAFLALELPPPPLEGISSAFKCQEKNLISH
jgi:hypothetical protein